MTGGRGRLAPGRGRMLEVVDVSVSFGAVRALTGVSLTVADRQFAGLIGPNGAGKTTLFNVISGFVQPTAGRLRLAGRRVTDWSPTRRARAGLSRTFQNVGLDKPATVEENLRAVQQVSTLRREALEWALPRRSADVQHRHEREEIIELLGLAEERNTPVAQLPMGLAKQVELGCALLRRPRLLLLDEPSSGLSNEETARLGQVLRDVHANRELAVLLIEHDMSLAMSLCEHLYVLDFGVPLADGTPEVIRANPKVVEAYLGQEAA